MTEWWRIYYNMMKVDNGRYFRDNMTVYDETMIQTFSL